MSFGLLDLEGAAQEFAEHLNSKEWWIFVFAGPEGTSLVREIEETFYTPGTEANKDFEIMLNPEATVAFARKSRLPADALCDLLPRASEEALRERDVIFLVPETER